jgi:hypothetical protein
VLLGDVALVDPGERRHLLVAAVPFACVQAASRLQGVTRVALIGLLTTEQVDPKDIGLLGTISTT